MKRLWLLLLLAAVSPAQVERPAPGVVVRAGGRLELLDGAIGAARALPVADGVLDARLFAQGIAAKTEDAIVLFDAEGLELSRVAAPAGRARFAGDRRPGADAGFFVAFEQDGALWRVAWPEQGGRPVITTLELPASGPVVAMHAMRDGRLRLARQDAAALRVEELDPLSGESALVDSLPAAAGPVAFDRDGRVVCAPAGAERLDPLAEGWFALTAGEQVLAWDGKSEQSLLPASTDASLVISWRKSLTEETVVGDAFEMPAAAPGAPSEARFRVRNTSSAPVRVFRLVVEGAPFQLFNDFIVPRDIAPDGTAEFWIRFTPPASGAAANGRLRLNDRGVELRGAATPVTLPEAFVGGQWTALSTSGANRIGDGERGIAWNIRLRMRATAGEPAAPSIAGAGFTLEPQGSGEYLLRADTAANGMMECQLTVSGRGYRLQVFVFEPAPPRPRIKLRNDSWAFAKQEAVEVEFSEASKSTLGGTLSVAFEPEAAGVRDDATIGWLPSLGRTASFTLEKGATKATFGTVESLLLQTGTTAGTIILTATVGGLKDERRIRLAPAAPSLQTAMLQGSDQRVLLRVTGYDPVRDVRRAAFTFYLRDGQVAAPGRIEADVTAAFRAYFAESATAGGTFLLNVQFPVSGTLSEVAGLEMELTNGVGATRTQRLAVQ